MVLHCELFHDDDVDAAGNLLTSADGISVDGKVDNIMGNWPVLRDILYIDCAPGGTSADVSPNFSRVVVQPNTWPSSKAITHFADCGQYIAVATEATTPIFTLGGASGNFGANILEKRGAYNVPMEANTDLVGATTLYSSETDSDVGLVMCYSYGTEHPYRGGRIHWVSKNQDAVAAAADVWDESFTDNLTGATNGLDPNMNYILRGLAVKSATAAKGAVAARIGRQADAFKLIGPAGADTSLAGVVYLHDGIPCSGLDGFTVETCEYVVDTSVTTVYMGFEEVGGARALSPSGTTPNVRRGGGIGGFGNLGLKGLLGRP